MFSFSEGGDDEILEFYNYSDSDEDWDDVENDDVENTESEDEEFDAELHEGSAELVLKSGIRIGSRQFNRYWKQNIRHTTLATNKSSAVIRVSGYNGSQQLAKRAQYLENKLKHKQANVSLRKQHDYNSRVGVKHNMLQHHYREQNPM